MSKRKLQSILVTLIVAIGIITYNQFQTWLQSNATIYNTATPTTTSNTSNIDSWSYEKYPDYYSVVGEAQIDESKFADLKEEIQSPDFEKAVKYTGKDDLNRTQSVYAIITLKTVQRSSAEERPDFKPNDNPSGWTSNSKVSIETSTGTYSGWFWNRSHLLADRLGGEATSNNAITGTRMQNVGNRSNSGGMYYIEDRTVDYLRTHRNHYVYYVVTPIYENNELIPRYVIVDVKSEDSVLNERVITYNYQNGYTVNYLNGGFTKN